MCEDNSLIIAGATGDSVNDEYDCRRHHYHPVYHIPEASDGCIRVEEEPIGKYLEKGI